MRISCKSLAADAFSNAAHCALMTASEGNVQAAKDNFQIRLLETRAAYVAAAGAATAKAKAVAFKAKAAEDSSKAKQLEQKARIAKTKAELFLSKCKSAAAIGEKASETSQ